LRVLTIARRSGRDDPNTCRAILPDGTLGRMSDVRRHLTIVIDPHAVREVAALRHRWDPAMAAGVPPHVTVVYPDEHVDLGAVGATAPFRLELGQVVAEGGGAGGVFVEVRDVDGGWTALRQRVVRSGRRQVRPHITIVHPRTSDRGPVAWAALRGTRCSATLAVTEVALTDTSREHGMVIVERYPFGRDG
jgi:hypothetical protein